MANKNLDKLIWQFSGADVQLISFSGPDSQRRFRWIGIASLFIIGITFVSTAHTLISIFDAFWMPLIGAVVFTFLIVSIYRLNMISMEPPSLPYSQEKGSTLAPRIIRITVVVIFAFFTSKQFEFLCFKSLTSDIDFSAFNLNKKYWGDSDDLFMQRMFILNSKYWFVWFITVGMLYLYLFPVVVKYKLFRNEKEYYRKKSVLEKDLVETQYAHFKTKYTQIFAKQNLNIIFNDTMYIDPPFNTKKVVRSALNTEEEFLKNFQ